MFFSVKGPFPLKSLKVSEHKQSFTIDVAHQETAMTLITYDMLCVLGIRTMHSLLFMQCQNCNVNRIVIIYKVTCLLLVY